MPFDRRGGGRGFGERERDDTPKPVKVGEEYDVEISEVGSRGDGIARVKNFVVFVNGTKQGEKAHIKITEVRNRFAIGEKTSESVATEATEAAVEESDESTAEESVAEEADETKVAESTEEAEEEGE